MTNPVKVFEAKAAKLKDIYIDKQISDIGEQLKQYLLRNLTYLSKVLRILETKITNNGQDWDNQLIVDEYFDIWDKDGNKIETFEEKQKLRGLISPLINKAFQEILLGQLHDQE